jgi:hypothetical protein
MKINLMNNEYTRWAFLEAIGSEHDLILDITKDFGKREDNSEFDVEFKVNGIELNFQNVIQRMIDIYDEQVEKTAKSLLTDKVTEIMNRLTEIDNSLEYVQNVVNKID